MTDNGSGYHGLSRSNGTKANEDQQEVDDILIQPKLFYSLPATGDSPQLISCGCGISHISHNP
jgi:hypothetical protein